MVVGKLVIQTFEVVIVMMLLYCCCLIFPPPQSAHPLLWTSGLSKYM